MITVLSREVKPARSAACRDDRCQRRPAPGGRIDGEECGTVSILASPVKEGTEIQVLPSVAEG
jgi:hypothetical protein